MTDYVVPDANTIITLAKMDKWTHSGFALDPTIDPTGGQTYLNQLLSPNSILVITNSVLRELTAKYGDLNASDPGVIGDWISQIRDNNNVLFYPDSQPPGAKDAGEKSIQDFIQSQSPGFFGFIWNTFGLGLNNVHVYTDDVGTKAFRKLTQELATDGVPGSVNSTTGFLSQLVTNGSIKADSDRFESKGFTKR
jgi:hypothetical protein